MSEHHQRIGRLGYQKVKERSDRMRERQKAEAYDRYVKVGKQCRCCEKKIPYEKRRNTYCDRSCRASYNNKKRRKHHCGCGVYIGCNRRYCANCKPVLTFETAGSDPSRKKALIEERGYCCESCKLSTWMGEAIPIELDHIDGNSDNNSRDNLRLLCPNCHAQTPTYKGRNLGNAGSRGRKRMEKLAE